MLFNRNPKGRIKYPINRASVPRLFRVEGIIIGQQAGQHLFLVVQVGSLFWPKCELVVTGKSWVAEVHEKGWPPNGKFMLSLYLVNATGYDEIVAWQKRGRLTDSFPGLRSVKGAIKLHSIKLCLEPH